MGGRSGLELGPSCERTSLPCSWQPPTPPLARDAAAGLGWPGLSPWTLGRQEGGLRGAGAPGSSSTKPG